MNKRKISVYTAVVGIFILVINILAMKGSLYFVFWWFDMPMHFLGGFWIGLITVLIFYKKFSKLGLTDNKKSIFVYLLSVIFIGLLWEFYEYFLEIFIKFDFANIVDSISDMLFDIAGSILLLIGLKNKF
ncbi:MAG: hypothetical protein R3B64_01175 [Candidatus Paceibacterota bacterium]